MQFLIKYDTILPLVLVADNGLLKKPLTTLLKTGRILQLHNPSVLFEEYPDIEEQLPVEGAAMFYPRSGALIVRCAGDTYMSVPQVCLLRY